MRYWNTEQKCVQGFGIAIYRDSNNFFKLSVIKEGIIDDVFQESFFRNLLSLIIAVLVFGLDKNAAQAFNVLRLQGNYTLLLN